MKFIYGATAIAALISGTEAISKISYNLVQDFKKGLNSSAHGTIFHPKQDYVSSTKLTSRLSGSKALSGLNVMRKQIKYGPYSVNGMNSNNGMQAFFSAGFQMPCTNCKILSFQAGLQYANGQTANIDTGAWLHHMVLVNNAEADTVCGKAYFIMGNRFFASGNERTPIDLTINGHVPAGYYIEPGASVWQVLELMNMNMDPINVYVTMDYEYVSGQPSQLANIRPAWLDISTCQGFSDVPAKSGVFSYTDTQTWTTQFEGSLVAVGGHLHDGGTTLPVMRNGKAACNCMAHYAQTKAFVSNTMGGSNIQHISQMTACLPPRLGYMNKGEQWTVVANYDMNKRKVLKNTDGSAMDVMGIAMIFVAENMSTATMNGYMKNCKWCQGWVTGPTGPLTYSNKDS